jgi:hypothetical protein
MLVFISNIRYSCPILMKIEFFDRFSKNNQIYFMKMLSVGAELFHAYRWTDGHYEANTRCTQFCERA